MLRVSSPRLSTQLASTSGAVQGCRSTGAGCLWLLQGRAAASPGAAIFTATPAQQTTGLFSLHRQWARSVRGRVGDRHTSCSGGTQKPGALLGPRIPAPPLVHPSWRVQQRASIRWPLVLTVNAWFPTRWVGCRVPRRTSGRGPPRMQWGGSRTWGVRGDLLNHLLAHPCSAMLQVGPGVYTAQGPGFSLLPVPLVHDANSPMTPPWTSLWCCLSVPVQLSLLPVLQPDRACLSVAGPAPLMRLLACACQCAARWSLAMRS